MTTGSGPNEEIGSMQCARSNYNDDGGREVPKNSRGIEFIIPVTLLSM